MGLFKKELPEPFELDTSMGLVSAKANNLLQELKNPRQLQLILQDCDTIVKLMVKHKINRLQVTAFWYIVLSDCKQFIQFERV